MVCSLFTSEAVSIGHPDKIADQISDAILDAALCQDPQARVACEVMVNGNFVLIGGEVSSSHNIDYETIARDTIRHIGYDDPELGFDADSCRVQIEVHEQSPDIFMGISEEEGLFHGQGAGDQGMMFGYACRETAEFMPLPITLAHRLMHAQTVARKSGALPYLRPDAKAQVTIAYNEELQPECIHTVVLSTQHHPSVSYEQLSKEVHELILETLPSRLIDKETIFYINPTGRFTIGGPVGDCGLTGRKTMVDTYGGIAHHGGGAFSGKDPSKVDRSGAYAARHIAKNVVGAGLAEKCEVEVAYAIGVPHPIALKVDTFGTAKAHRISEAVADLFDLTPHGIIEAFGLRRPIYSQVSYGGHFGRPELDLPWERLDKVEALQQAARQTPPLSGRPASVSCVMIG